DRSSDGSSSAITNKSSKLTPRKNPTKNRTILKELLKDIRSSQSETSDSLELTKTDSGAIILKEDEYKVADFGDFPLYQKAKLLNICKVNKGLIQAYVSMIFELVRAINDWLNCTGNELIIDPMMFKSAFPALSKNNNDKVI
ncbi:MAG: hypothetical protein NTZ34_02810, partial [Chloroflexi bacterium]|nr:hypothetical protein [Chloroflexota bacterium]